MPKGYVLLVLHAHLPYVRHPEYDYFLEEQWLFEAMTETYIPLIKFLDKLRADGDAFRLTISVSPTLAAMLEDPLLQQRYVRHLNRCMRLAEREMVRTRHTPDVNFLAGMYRHLFEEARQTFVERCGMRLAKAFGEFAEAGYVELITCTATHGFLPALNLSPESVSAQIRLSVQEHERIFGQKPKGMWVPECAYYTGLDALLADAGLRYFFVETHGIEHAEPRPRFGVSAPIYCPSGVAAFGRHPATSRLVWSDKVGYPSDPNYREYHRDIGFDLEQSYLEEFQYAPGVRSATGLKYHRITGPTADKQLYNPDRGRETAVGHARDFLRRCRDMLARSAAQMPLPPVIVSPYDAELFGHWWFEGPQWLYHVMREAAQAKDGDVALTTPSEYLVAHPVQQKASPAPSSWGRNGYSEHWINPKTEWMWQPLYEAAERLTACATAETRRAPDPLRERILNQAARELLLAQASDWPFMITNGTTEKYGRRRFHDHLNRFHGLLNSLDPAEVPPSPDNVPLLACPAVRSAPPRNGTVDERRLACLEYMDAIFPKIDYRVFARAEQTPAV